MAWTTPGTAVAGSALTAAFWNLQVRDNMTELAPFSAGWTSYTPSLTGSTTNPTLGSGSSVSGIYVKVGRFVTGSAKFTFGTGASSGSGAYSISLPVTANTTNRAIGDWFGQDQSAGARHTGVVFNATTTTISLAYTGTSGFPQVGGGFPWTWGDSDILWTFFCYESAS